MILHFFIIFSILAFIFATLYALFSIVIKVEFKFVNTAIQYLKKSSLGPVAFLFCFGIIFIVLYGLSKSSSYQFSYNVISTDGSTIGAIGDLFNGLIAPTVSMISIVYLWRAFVQQYKANQMLYNFEIEKSFKDDLDWLRNNSVLIEELEKEIENKNNEQLKDFFSSTKIIIVRKAIYIINTFEQFYIKLESKKSQENNFSDANREILLVLETLYLPTMKSIYRSFGNYIVNFTDDQKEIIDLKKPEIEYLKRFANFYMNVPDLSRDKLFEATLQRISDIIK